LLLVWEGIDLQLCFHRWGEEHGQEQSLNRCNCRLLRWGRSRAEGPRHVESKPTATTGRGARLWPPRAQARGSVTSDGGGRRSRGRAAAVSRRRGASPAMGVSTGAGAGRRRRAGAARGERDGGVERRSLTDGTHEKIEAHEEVSAGVKC
jgi:hypothetical protein